MAVPRLGWPYDLLTLEEWDNLDPIEGGHVECVEGVLVVAPRPFLLHQLIRGQLVVELKSQLPDDVFPIAEVAVLLTEVPLTVRTPDVVVLPVPVLEATSSQLKGGDVRLAVEVVSTGSRGTDTVMKHHEYAEAGIAEYWILDGDPLTLTAYALDESTYRLDGTYQGVAELDACGTTVRLDLDTLSRR